jgi:hypothetical protein
LFFDREVNMKVQVFKGAVTILVVMLWLCLCAVLVAASALTKILYAVWIFVWDALVVLLACPDYMCDGAVNNED